jgi:hypothetical protein
MGFEFKPPPPRRCECRVIPYGQNTTDPDSFRKCREHASRFINTTNGRVFLCTGHFHSHTVIGSGQDVQVVSRTRGRTA